MTFDALRYILIEVRMKRYFQQIRKIYVLSKAKKNEFTSISEIKHETVKNPGVETS